MQLLTAIAVVAVCCIVFCIGVPIAMVWSLWKEAENERPEERAQPSSVLAGHRERIEQRVSNNEYICESARTVDDLLLLDCAPSDPYAC